MPENKIRFWTMIKYLLVVSVFILLVLHFEKAVAAVGRLLDILYPLLMGVVFAYIVNIIMRALERIYFPNSQKKIVLKSRRFVCIFLSFLLIIGILVLIFTMIIPELAGAISIIAQGVSIAFERVRDLVLEHSGQFPEIAESLEGFQVDWKATLERIADIAIGGMGDLVSATVSVIGSVVGGVVNVAIAAIFSVYILANKEKLKALAAKLLRVYVHPRIAKRVRKLTITAHRTFSSFIVGQCTEAVILGSLCMVGMWIFRFPYAPMIGAFVGTTALIPIVGAYVGAGVGAIMILTVDPIRALWFLVFIIILQQLEGNLIYPRVVGSSIGLPGIWVLAAVTVGGGLGGILGMLLGVPATATVYKLLREDVNRRAAKQAREAAVKHAAAAAQKGPSGTEPPPD